MSLRLNEKEYAELYRAVLKRDHWRCRSCGMRSGLHCHHVVFRSQGGEDTKENLCTLCSSCHDGVHKDVKDGQYGLTIRINNVGDFVFIRRPDWKPQ
jgi:5-methylcytosine-specific restriction endonuclease McrA